jgi:hypothetical protein
LLPSFPAANETALPPGARAGAAELKKVQRVEYNGEPRAAPGAAEAGSAEGAGGVLPHAEPTPRAPALCPGAGGLAGGALPQRLVDAASQSVSAFVCVLPVLVLMETVVSVWLFRCG